VLKAFSDWPLWWSKDPAGYLFNGRLTTTFMQQPLSQTILRQSITQLANSKTTIKNIHHFADIMLEPYLDSKNKNKNSSRTGG